MGNTYKNKKIISILLAAGLIIGQMGCGQTEEEDILIILENSAEERIYSLAVASISDVVDTDSIKCDYVQTKDEEISFSLSGKTVAVVYVENGDMVEEGQLLAELANTGLKEEISRLEYRIARNQLLYEQSLKEEENALEGRLLQYQYQSRHTTEEEAAYKQDVEDIERSYRYIQEDYQDAIHADTLKLNELQSELAGGYIYAGMSGTVSYIKPDLEGSISVQGETVIKIIDGTECVFVTHSVEYAEFFEENTSADFLIVTISGAVQCKLVPFQMEEWGDELYFKVQEDEEVNLNLNVGSSGTMKIVVAKKEQVLSIPANAVHTADGSRYVYVIGEDNMREIKWVETGLIGDSMVEILSGLSEGERVIIK